MDLLTGGGGADGKGGGGAQGKGGGGSLGKGGGGDVGSGGWWEVTDLVVVHFLDSCGGINDEANVALKAAGEDFCSTLSVLKCYKRRKRIFTLSVYKTFNSMESNVDRFSLTS